MSDDDVEMVLAKRMPVSARFIEQAHEYIRATGERTVNLLVLSEVPIEGELTCAGVSTRKLLAAPVAPTREASQPTQWTLNTLSESVVLDIITAQGPISTRNISNALGIQGGDASLRNRVRRVLQSLVKGREIRQLGDKRYPKFTLAKTSSRMQVRPAALRQINRRDITLDKVIEQLRGGPATSRIIGDKLGIPRQDNIVRSKITEHVRTLQKDGRARRIHTERQGERIYELVGDSQPATA